MGGPHAHDEKPKKEAKVDDADKEKEEYSAKMAKKGAGLYKHDRAIYYDPSFQEGELVKRRN